MGVIVRAVAVHTLGVGSKQNLVEERALRAAKSGLEYAKSRLAQDPTWKGEDPVARTIDGEFLVVEERNGNVFGLMCYPDGSKAQFRIRFNFQDGPGGGDDLNDPPPSFRINNGLVSINNLTQTSELLEPVCDDQGVVQPNLASEDRTVPPRSALIRVEGRAGPGIDKIEPNQLMEEPRGYFRTAEQNALLKFALNDEVPPAVIQSAGTVTLIANSGVTVHSLSEQPPVIRTKQDMSVLTNGGSLGTLSMPGGEVFTDSGTLNAIYDPDDLTVLQEPSEAPLTSIRWDDVPKPDPHTHTVRAGVYVLWPPQSAPADGSSYRTDYELHYYDMSYQEYSDTYGAMILAGELPPPGVVMTGDISEQNPGYSVADSLGIQVEQNSITVTKDLYVQPTEMNSDFAIMPLGMGAVSSSDPDPGGTVVITGDGKLQPIEPEQPLELAIIDSRIYAQGDMVLRGGVVYVSGATLIGEKSLVFHTPTVKVDGGQDNLSLYFKENILVSSYDRESSSYGAVGIRGTVYSWGDVVMRIGEGNPDVPGGFLEFTGSLVAFGNDPSGLSPGPQGSGAVAVFADQANFSYDPTAIFSVVSPEVLGGNINFQVLSSWSNP